MKTGEHWEKPERWNGPQERPKQPSRKRGAITKARGRFNIAETREQNTGGRDSGFFGETKTVEGFAGCRGKPWELPWENSGGAGETRGTGLELRTEVHTGGTTAGEHREGKNK